MIQNLIDITDKLVIKSKESILQSDLKLQQKKRNDEIYNKENDIDSDDNDEYVLFIAQLNSLHIRSKYIRDKLKISIDSKKPNNSTSKPASLIIDNPDDYVKHLVYEYKDITTKLNTFARNNLTINDSISNDSKSPSSQSSNESFQPKPLKIYSRQRDSLLLESFNVTSTFPIGESSITNNNNISITENGRRLSCHNSLPNSPIKQIHQQHNSFNAISNKILRSSKSYNDGLNTNKLLDKKKKRKTKEEDEYQRLFKQKNRLSLSLVGYEQDNEQDFTSNTNNDTQTSYITANIVSDYESDQDTIMQCNSPLIDNYSEKQQQIRQEEPALFEPLRRYNSHESILSTKNSMLLNRKSKPLKFSLFSTNLNNPTVATSQNVQVNSNPIFANTSVNNMYNNNNNNNNRTHIHSKLHQDTTQKIRSTDLLQSVMKDMNGSTQKSGKNRNQNKPKTKTSFFDNWNVFNKYSMTLTSEVAKNDLNNIDSINHTKTSHIQTFRKQLSDDTVVISTIISSRPNSRTKMHQTHNNNDNNIHLISHDDNIVRDTKKIYLYTNPQNDMIENQKNVKFSDLHDALDTELIL
ncbi:hypothetical protein C6P45_001597 [Maudiozyma exigua]|uniref:Uncharacterized protein n=1 Tax=Maudiozyma exigua TaxID=34358 RepID=A0A9P6W256_MAUEX|nr:hypothetical protein C6P45_001597 [Kazachstania exigua]